MTKTRDVTEKEILDAASDGSKTLRQIAYGLPCLENEYVYPSDFMGVAWRLIKTDRLILNTDMTVVPAPAANARGRK